MVKFHKSTYDSYPQGKKGQTLVDIKINTPGQSSTFSSKSTLAGVVAQVQAGIRPNHS